MSKPDARPEDRRRRAEPQPHWADTVPGCFRSEAFAEDLLLHEVTASPQMPLPPSGWRGVAAMPLLGVPGL